MRAWYDCGAGYGWKMEEPTGMTKTFRLLLAIVGVLLFTVGLLVGDQVRYSRFEKYLRPNTVAPMQLAMLQANMDIIRDRVPAEDIAVPTIYYEPLCRCFSGTAWISGDLLKRPLDEVRQKLMVSAIFARGSVGSAIPEMHDWKPDSPDPFRMTFWQFKGTTKVVVAEWVDGKIVFN